MNAGKGIEPGEDLAGRLDYLFKTVRRPDGSEHTYREVADAISRTDAGAISASYIWQLRAGAKDNPTRRHIEGLAAFFDVTPAYFLDDPERAATAAVDVALRAALEHGEIRTLAIGARGLSGESLAVLGQLVDQLRRLERLDGRGSPGEGQP